MKKYQEINSQVIDQWAKQGWKWAQPISHADFIKAKDGDYDVLLTPNKRVPHFWLGDLRGKKILGLACGGAQQMPVFSALGGECTVFDNSAAQLASEKLVAEKEGYKIRIVKGDMSSALPFADEEFDLVFFPVANCYIEETDSLFLECARVLKKGGVLLSGLDIGINFLFDETESKLINALPFNPLKNPEQMKQLNIEKDGIQFSHSIEEDISGQLKAGFVLKDIFEDTNDEGPLKEAHVACYLATYSIKG